MNHPSDRFPARFKIQGINALMRGRVDRRRFLRRAGMGWLIVVGLGTMAGCGKPTPSGFRNVGSLKLLEEEGKIFDEHFSSEPLLVVRGPKKKGSKELGPIAAVSPTCPHQKCLVNWDKVQEAFICPCHQSRFDMTGRHLQGVAKENLKTYPIEIRGEEIWVENRFQ
jgi:cytochrome b6-f complex iron-sulfur subunit